MRTPRYYRDVVVSDSPHNGGHRMVLARDDHLPAGLIAQLVEHCTGIAEVMGSKTRSSLNFFQAFFS